MGLRSIQKYLFASQVNDRRSYLTLAGRRSPPITYNDKADKYEIVSYRIIRMYSYSVDTESGRVCTFVVFVPFIPPTVSRNVALSDCPIIYVQVPLDRFDCWHPYDMCRYLYILRMLLLYKRISRNGLGYSVNDKRQTFMSQP